MSTTKLKLKLNLIQGGTSSLFRKFPRLYFGFRHEIIDRFRKQPILIYQVGKVGSSTIYNSLSHYPLGRSIYHIHNLNLECAQKLLKGVSPKNEPKPRGEHLWHSLYLSRKMARQNNKKWPVITLVREPVGRNVSAFFQGLDRSHPKLFQEGLEERLECSRLLHHFLKDFHHDGLFEWFGGLKTLFNTDVYAIPSPREKGYVIYENALAKVLLLRMEDINNCAPSALKKFLGIDDFILRSENIGMKKRYKRIYKSFLKDLRLPDSYLDRMYDTQYARHFYSEAEIASLRSKWRGA